MNRHYLVAPVDRNDNNDPCDVMFSRSSDGGETWTSPIKINDDPSEQNWSWFPTMSVAPNGRIDMVWVDTRDHPNSYLSALYYSYSLDGGISWSANEKLSDYFDPHLGWPNQEKIGDYYHMISDNTGAHLAWSATFNGEQDVFYSHIIFDESVAVFENNQSTFEFAAFPNPTNGDLYVFLDENLGHKAKIELTNLTGQLVLSIITFPEVNSPNKIIIPKKDLDKLDRGIYFLGISTKNKEIQSIKIVLN